MRIKELNTGKSYDLTPGTMVEVERTNPFLNEYGEMSVPMTLPDTRNNRMLTGYLHDMANKRKPGAGIACLISDGAYVMRCRQAILGARKGDGITTSFYMNEGSFYSRLSKVSLKEVFGSECVPGVSSMSEALSWIRSIKDGSDPNFAIFPVLVRYGSWSDSGEPRYKLLNRYGEWAGQVDFWNSWAQDETIGEDIYKLPVGCDITPFMRVKYLLTRILAYFGYTFSPNFLTTEEPFASMVILNNTADAIVGGSIRLTQLLPDCSCNDILDVIRKRFNVEFIPDETNMTVNIVKMGEVLAAAVQCDLTDRVDGELQISYPEQYRQLRLVNASPINDDKSPANADTLADLFADAPNASYDPRTGDMIQAGYAFNMRALCYNGVPWSVSRPVSGASMPYQADGTMETETVEMKDRVAEMREPYYFHDPRHQLVPFIGGYRYLNTTITTPGDDGSIASDENGELLPMLCFVFNYNGISAGTVTNRVSGYGTTSTKLWNFTLLLHGEDGIYERFYREYDDLLRNSLHTVTARLMLSQTQKMSLHSHLPVIIKGQRLWPKVLRYLLGAESEPVECEFVTLRHYTPVTFGKSLAQWLDEGDFSFVARHETTTCSSSEYNSGLKLESDRLFPVRVPTASGQVLAERTCYHAIEAVGAATTYYKIRYWLESVSV